MKIQNPTVQLQSKTRLVGFGPPHIRWRVVRLTSTTVTLDAHVLNVNEAWGLDAGWNDGDAWGEAVDVCTLTFMRDCRPAFLDLDDPKLTTVDANAVPIDASGAAICRWMWEHRRIKVHLAPQRDDAAEPDGGPFP